MPEARAFIELDLNAGRMRAGLRNAQKTFKRTMSRFVGFANSAFRRIRGLFFNFRAWATIAATAFTANRFLREADKYKAAMMGLVSVALFKGIPALEAMAAAEELSADGLISIQEASLSMKNLLQRGFGLEESIGLLKRFKDAAVFGRQGSLELGQAIVSATEGLKNENSILVDNAGVTKNVSVMWKEYAAAQGLAVAKMTTAQKRQAEINGIFEETEAMVGNAAQFTKIWAGQVAALSTQAKISMAEIGTAMQGVLGELGILDTLKEKLTGVTEWFNKNKETIVEWGLLVGETFSKLPEIVKISWTAIKDIFDASWNALNDTARLAWQRILLDPTYLGNLIVGLGDFILDGISNILLSAIVGFKNLGAIIITPLVAMFDIMGKAIGTGIFNGLQDAKGHINTFVTFINNKLGTNLGLLDVQKKVVVNYAHELQKTVSATGLAIKSQWDITKEENKTAFDLVISNAEDKLKLLSLILHDPLISKNWEQSSGKAKKALNAAIDDMKGLLAGIQSTAAETGAKVMESLGTPAGAGQVPRAQKIESPLIDTDAKKKWKEHLKTISGLYKDHAEKILNSDSFTLEKKKELLAEERSAFISLGGKKEEVEKLTGQVTMELQRQRFQELIELNQTSEATMHEARMGFLQTYMESYQTSMASLKELTLRFYTDFIGWYRGAFSSAMEQLVIDGKNVKDVLHDLGMSFKRMMVRWAADYIAQKTIAYAFEKTARSTYLAGIMATQSTQLGTAVPLATAVSLYSFGANAPPAIAGMTSAATVAAGLFAPKMHEGGEVNGEGPGRGQERLRLLNRGEFVVRNDRRNLQVEVPAGGGGNTYNVNVTVNADNLDRNNVSEIGEDLAEKIVERINEMVDRGETVKSSELRVA
jgi:hypothetical protein